MMVYIISAIVALTLALAVLLPTSAKAEYLTDFSYGVLENDTRNFVLIVEENNKIPITSPAVAENNTVYFPAWTFNGTVPGPTMRMTEGDRVSITVINSDKSEHSHSLHMHSTHPPDMDGTFGPSGAIAPGQSFTYEFIAGPTGVYPYHCHVEPIVDHINRGLYGAMIIDPKEPRSPAQEMVMMMNSYDLFLNEELEPSFRSPNASEAESILNQEEEPELELDRGNEFYTINGRALEYMDNPIDIKVGEPVRVYLLSMTEFDPVNSFHLHSGMFNYTASGTENTPAITTDIVTLGQGDRGIVEFTPQHPGKMMVHAHVNEFTALGWMATFDAIL